MSILIITDNSMWGGSEVLWSRMHRRPDVDSVVWCPHGMTWLPNDVRRAPLVARTLRQRMKRLPGDNRIAPSLEVDSLLYVMCCWMEPLVWLMANTVEPYLNRGIRTTVLVQAVNGLLWPSDKVLERIRSIHPGIEWVFVSQENRSCVAKQLPEVAGATVLPNPPSKSVVPSPLDLEAPWAFVGRLHVESKGLDLLLEAAVDFPVRIDLFGDGPNARALRAYADRLGTNVHFAGFVEDVSAVWQNHSVLILPSRLEGLPLCLLEAGLCGRPALVTRAVGAAEIVGDDGGLVVEANTADLRSGMLRMLAARDKWAAMGQHLQRRCRSLLAADPVDRLIQIVKGYPYPANLSGSASI